MSVAVVGFLILDLNWSIPPSGAVDYKVEWSTDGGPSWSVLADNVSQLGYTHICNLLTPGSTFQDCVIIDGAALISEITVSAIKVADIVLIPVRHSGFDIRAVDRKYVAVPALCVNIIGWLKPYALVK